HPLKLAGTAKPVCSVTTTAKDRTETDVEAARKDPDGFSDAGLVPVLAPSRSRFKKPNQELQSFKPVLTEPCLTESFIIIIIVRDPSEFNYCLQFYRIKIKIF